MKYRNEKQYQNAKRKYLRKGGCARKFVSENSYTQVIYDANGSRRVIEIKKIEGE